MAEWILSSSVLILVLAVLRHVWKGKVSLRLQYALWGLVLVRLLVPVSFFESGFSVLNLTKQVQEQSAVQTFADLAELEVPSRSFDDVYAEVVQEYEKRGVDVSELEGSELEALDYEAMALMGEISLGELVKKAAYTLWIAGVGIVGAVFLISNFRFGSKLKKERMAIECGNCPLPVYRSSLIETPCLFGLFRPAVYVTAETAEEETALRHVLVHEMTHYYHGDHIWSALRCLCLAVHWYNPLVWLAAVLSRRDAELACDEGAIGRLGEEEREAYGRTLIGLTCQNRSALLLTATTMTGGKRSIRERVMFIARKPRMAAYTFAAVVLIVAVAVGCTFTGAKETDEQPTETVEQPIESIDSELESSEAKAIFQCGDYEVEIPAECLYDVWVEIGEGDDGLIISVTELASLAASERDGYSAEDGLGWLFSIVRYNRTEYERTLCADASGISFFARDDQWYYAYVVPTDVRYYRSGDDALSEDWGNWEELNAMGPSVREDFITRNGLEPYDDSAIWAGYTYEGEHRFVDFYPYFYANGSTDEGFVFVLSQPVRQGKGGIWCVERMMDGYGNVYLWFPDSGMPSAEYYAQLQAECVAGSRTDLLDIEQVCIYFIEESGYFGGTVVDGSLEVWNEGAVPLTAAQIAQINEAFNPVIYDRQGNPIGTNTWSCFFTSHYDDVRELDFEKFLAYFPGDGSTVGEEEFAALKELDSFLFRGEVSTLSDMPVPVHRYPRRLVDMVLKEYAGITTEDLDTSGVEYLVEYDAYYNYTSDFGPGTFTCTRGEILGDVVLLYEKLADNGSRVLTLREEDGRYVIVSFRLVY